MNPKEQLMAALTAKDVQVETQKREREEQLLEEKQRSRAHTERYVNAVATLNEQITEWVEGLDFEITNRDTRLSEDAEPYDTTSLILVRGAQYLSFTPKGKSTGEYLGTITVVPRKSIRNESLTLSLASTENSGPDQWFLAVFYAGQYNVYPFDAARFYDLLKINFA